MGCGDSKPASENSSPKDKYKELKVLGRGASCKVVEVELKSDKSKRSAMKILQKSKDFSAKLFKHEVDILADLEHENILQVIESFEDAACFYLVTVACKGGELFDRIVDNTFDFTEKMAAKLVRTMLDSIKYIHDKGIVHRDLKPENYIFETTDPNSRMILIDFGCALRVDDDQIYTDTVGTPYYLAPESARRKTVRTGKTLKSSDLWSIGVITFVMMSGRPPFKGNTNKEIFRSILKDKLSFRKKDNIGKELRNLLEKKILLKNWKDRVSVEEALMDPWVLGKEASDKRITKDVITGLRQFQYQNRLKKALTRSLAANMGDQALAEVRQAFDRLDTDGNGTLSVDELTQLLNEHLDFTSEDARREAEKMMEAHDKDGDDGISFEEFAEVWQRNMLMTNKKYMKCVFDVLDADGDGGIDAEELQQCLMIKDMQEIAQMIQEVDANGDGKIDFEEFQAAMTEKVCALRPDGDNPNAQIRIGDDDEVFNEEAAMMGASGRTRE